MNRLHARPALLSGGLLSGAFSGALAAGMILAGAAHAQGVEAPANSVLAPSPPPASEGTPPSGYAWGGGWMSNHYAGAYGGGMLALNPNRSLWEDGFAVRGDISAGRYSYNAIDRHVGLFDGDLLVGYRKATEAGNFGGYVGVAHIKHDNNDPAARLRGSKTGVAVLGEYSNTINKKVEVNLQGRYAEPFSSWSVSGRALWKMGDYQWFGPQVSFLRNDDYKEMTVGPLLKTMTSFGEVGLSGGWRHPIDSNNKDGYFASVYVAVPIR